MIRRLIAAAILLAVAAILVSPLVDLDDAVHHHQHHQQVGLAANIDEPAIDAHGREDEPPFKNAMTVANVDSQTPAMRC